MAPEDLKTLGLRATEELFNQGDLAVVDEFLDPGYTEHVVAEDETISLDQLTDRITALRRPAPTSTPTPRRRSWKVTRWCNGSPSPPPTWAAGRRSASSTSRASGPTAGSWSAGRSATRSRCSAGSAGSRSARPPETKAPRRTVPRSRTTHGAVPRRGPLVAVGAVCGLAWSAALRGYMVELVGSASTFTWGGTFGALLLPGAVAGGLLGWAEHLRRTGPPPGWRWLAPAPLTLAVAPMLVPGAVTTLARSGEGSGAIAVGLMGIVGGYALSGRGRRWPRALCGAAGAGFAAALVATVPGMTDSPLSLTDARGAWAGVLAGSLYAVLALGCSIPHRTTEAAPTTR